MTDTTNYKSIKNLCFILILAFTFVSENLIAQQEIPKANRELELKIALLQLSSVADQFSNQIKGEEFCRKAKTLNADIALFPEMVNIGYKCVDFNKPGAIEKWKAMGVNRDGEFIKHFQKLAKELEMAIAITYLEKTDNLPKNSVSLIDRHGNIVMNYSKVHTVDPFSMETATTPGDDFYVADLDTKIGTVKVGLMICYDREFPESARILMLKGAEVILTPNACGLDSLRLMQFRVRAFENSVVTVMTNYAITQGINDGFNGHSCAFNADGSKIVVEGEDDGVYIAKVNMQDTRNIRLNSIWGNAYRRPHRYKELISPNVAEPFVRKNGFGMKFNRLER